MTDLTRPIVIGHLHHTFYEVAARVVAHHLAQIGHQVAFREGAHADLYPELAAGRVDLLVATWAPHLHAPFYEPVKDQLTTVGRCFEGACGFWAVPDYLPAALVTTVADLTRAEVVARIDAQVAAPTGAVAIHDRARAVFEGYDLADAGYAFASIADDRAWTDQLRRRFAAGTWFVTPLWQPHFLNRLLSLRRLAEPRALMGGVDAGLITANRRFAATAPQAVLDTLGTLTIGLEGITEMDYLVNVDGLSAGAAATAWLDAHGSSA